MGKRNARALATARTYNADRRRTLVAEGLCRDCLRRPYRDGFVTCERCAAINRERMARARRNT